MRRLTLVLTMVTILAGVAISAASVRGDDKAPAGKPPVTNTVCPLMGDAVSPKVRVEHDGQWVYFCCAGCVEMFKADPAAAIAKMSDADREAIKKNTKCAISGEEITSFDVRSEHEGRFVYFCCASCKAKFDAKNAPK